MGSGCKQKCRFKCQTKITNENRQKAYDEFWGLKDRIQQWQCINNWVTKKSSKKHNSSDESESDNEDDEKEKRLKYLLPIANDKPVSVCKIMFLNTLGKLNVIYIIYTII